MDEKTKKSNAEEESKENAPAAAGEQETDQFRQEMEKVQQELGKLGQELENARKEKDEVFSRLQRVYADYANFQKRVPKNIADTVAYEKERFIRSFLPVLDNFDRTLREAQAAQNVEAVVQGVQIIRDQMLTILKSYGVETIESLNEKFDPARHEAMIRRSEPDKENDTVVEEFQKGYMLNGRVIRPSRVAINKIGTPAPATPARATEPQQQMPSSEEPAPAPGTEATETVSEDQGSTE
jgi:molecular chaperone GrpE